MATVQEFAAKIKAKYPAYKDMDDRVLAEKFVAKYPVYAKDVVFGEPVEKSVGEKLFPSATAAEKIKNPLLRTGAAALGVATDVLTIPQRALAAATTDQEFGDPGAYLGRETAETRASSETPAREENFKPVAGNPTLTAQNMMIGGAKAVPEEIARPIREVVVSSSTDPLTWLDAPLKAMLKAGEITTAGAKRLAGVIRESGPRGAAMVERGTEAGEAAIKAGAAENVDELAAQTEREIGGANKVIDINNEAAATEFANEKKLEAAAEGGERRQDATAAQAAFQSEADAAESARQADLQAGLDAAGVKRRETAYARGSAIVDAAENAKKAVGKRVGEQMQGAVKENKVGEVSIKMPSSKDVPEWVSEPPTNMVQGEALNILKEAGYNPKRGELGSLDNSVVTESGIKALKRYYKKYANLETFDDAVLARQEIGQELFSKRLAEDGDRVTGSATGDLKAAARMYDAINERVLAPAFARAIPDPELAKQALGTWLEAKESYSGLSKGVERLRLNLENKKEDIIASLADFGVDNYKKLTELARTSPEVKTLVDEMKGGLTDALVASATKGGEIDYKAARKAWDEIPPEVKDMVFPPEQVSSINKTFDDFEAFEVPAVPKKGDLLSKLPDTKARKAPEKTPRVGAAIGKDAKGIVKRLEKISDPDQRYALQELHLLDMLAGREGAEALAVRASNAAKARSIGMRPDGSLPKFDPSRLKSTTGGLAAGSAATAIGVALATGRPAAALAAVPGTAYSIVRASPYLEAQATRALVRYAERAPSKALNDLARRASKTRDAAMLNRVLDAIRREMGREDSAATIP